MKPIAFIRASSLRKQNALPYTIGPSTGPRPASSIPMITGSSRFAGSVNASLQPQSGSSDDVTRPEEAPDSSSLSDIAADERSGSRISAGRPASANSAQQQGMPLSASLRWGSALRAYLHELHLDCRAKGGPPCARLFGR